MVIQHNLAALNAHRNLSVNNKQTSGNLEKLSSGFRINRAADDAAGLAISEKMRGQIRGLAMAEVNTSHAINLVQTAEGGLNEVHSILHRMRELGVQASNGTYVDEDRLQIEKEFQALKSEIDRIAGSTHYNGIKLLDGSLGGDRLGALDAADLTKALTDASLDKDYTLKLDGAYSDLAGEAGNLVVNAQGQVFLTVADRTYVGELVSVGGEDVYQFYDLAEDPKALVATLAHAGNDVTDFGTASPKEDPFVLTNMTLSDTTATKLEDMEDAILGTLKSELIFQIGANGGADQRVGLHVINMSTGNLGVTTKGTDPFSLFDTTLVTREDANFAIDIIDKAVNEVSAQRASLGALQNRLEHTLNNLGITKENLTAAESTIRDVDMAKEMMEFTKNNILVQASQAMLAQANALPQGILSLLQ